MSRIIRIFFSSPGDVATERDLARRVVGQLAHRLRRRFRQSFQLESIFWEDLPLLATAPFQTGIESAAQLDSIRRAQTDLILSEERGIDIAVFILWSRLGTPLAETITRADGTPYRSGTEREFDLMVEAFRTSGHRPKILVYVRKDEAAFFETLRDQPQQRRDLLEQKDLVDQFIAEEFHDADSGVNLRAYLTYDRPTTFSQRLREHLTTLIAEAMGKSSEEDQVEWDDDTQGPPYRGLQAYDFSDAPIFFGREDETLEVHRILRRQALDGRAFVLLAGASGSGKSSLARAGLLPYIVEEELDEKVTAWRTAILTPAQLGSDPVAGLVQILASDGAVPELRTAGFDTQALRDLIVANPAAALKVSLIPVLAAAGPSDSSHRLLLLVDQLEELFTDPQNSDRVRHEFAAVLEALATSGVCWVVATLRSDFFAPFQTLEPLLRLKQGGGHYDVLPPETAALRRVIEGPAHAAGLTFEAQSGAQTTLADEILNEATSRAELLPLLADLLRELYDRRADRTLTFEAFKTLGGVEGSLARRAETVFADLPATVQATLPAVLRQLVALSGTGDGAAGVAAQGAVRRTIPLDTFPMGSDARTLVDALIAGRLLVTSAERTCPAKLEYRGTSESAPDGTATPSATATVTLAHEALLRVWPQAAVWVEDNREFLRVRDRVAARRAEGSPLTDGDPLTEAARFQLSAVPDGFSADDRAFIEQCLTTIATAKARRIRTRRNVTAGLGALSTIAILFALVALLQLWETRRQRTTAIANEEKAKTQQKAAEAARDATDRLLGISSVQLANSKMRDNRYDLALTALNESPKAVRNWDWGYARSQISPELLKFEGHTRWVNSAAWSPDGTRIVTASSDGAARVLDTVTGKTLATLIGQTTLATLMGRQSSLRSAVWSPNGTRILTASEDENAYIWDPATGKILAKLQGHSNTVNLAEWSPEGTRILTASADNTARVWNATTGKTIATLQGHTDFVNFAAWSLDGTRIATASRDNTSRIWDSSTGEILATLQGHKGSVYSAIWSPNGTRVLTASYDNTARIWDPDTGKALVILQGHTSAVRFAAWSPDGTRIVTASNDKTARVWDPATGKTLAILQGHASCVDSAAWSPDGTRVVTASEDNSASQDNTARVWEAATGKNVAILQGHTDSVSFVAWSPDGNRIVTASADKTARVWDPSTIKAFTTLQGHKNGVWSAAWGPDGTRIVTASGNAARVWDSATGNSLATLQGHTKTVYSSAWSPTGTRILTASQDGTVRVWDATTGQALLTLKGHKGWVKAEAWSADETRILTSSQDGTTRVWDLATGKTIATLKGHKSGVNSAVWNPSGTLILTASGDRTARVWNSATLMPLVTLQGHESGVDSATWNLDGTRIVTASTDKSARIWDPSTGKSIATLLGHTNWVRSATWSPDGTRIVTSSWDDTARVWEPITGKTLTTLQGHSDGVNSAAWSPDGTCIITASSDNTARIWEAAPWREVPGSPNSDGLPIEEQFRLWKLKRYRDWQVRQIYDKPDSALGGKTREALAAEVTDKFKAAYPEWAKWF